MPAKDFGAEALGEGAAAKDRWTRELGLRFAHRPRGVLGVSNTTDFYRSHSAGELPCIGTPVHYGRSAHVWQVEVTRSADGKLVARGQVRFHVLHELPAERTQEYAGMGGRK